jgi:prolyl oligopeptidase
MGRRLFAAIGVLLLAAGCASAPPPRPNTPSVRPTQPPASARDLTDRFQWLEDIVSPRSMAWVTEQNTKTLGVIERDPRYAEVLATTRSLANAPERPPTGIMRGGFVYTLTQDTVNPRGLWRRTTSQSYLTPTPAWETLLDVDALARTESRNWVFKEADCLAPSTSRCMISLSDGGRDAITIREFDTSTRAFVDGGFVLPEGKSSVAWVDGNTILVAADLGPGSMTRSGYPSVVKLWGRGESIATAREVFRGAETDVMSIPIRLEGGSGRVEMLVAQLPTFFSTRHYALGTGGASPAARIPLPDAARVHALFQGELVFSLNADWQAPAGRGVFRAGSVASAPWAKLEASARAPGTAAPTNLDVKTIWAPGVRDVLNGVAATRDALVLDTTSNVRARAIRAQYDGRFWLLEPLAMPSGGAQAILSADPDQPTMLMSSEDFLRPEAIFSVTPGTRVVAQVWALPPRFNAAPYITEQFEALSADGTRVPYFVVRRRAMALDGSAPTLVYAYGGFQIPMTPAYAGFLGTQWLDRGGVYVLANVRGGGEFGPAWHAAGQGVNRQRVVEDLIAVQSDLIGRRITSARRLGLMGGSNGGLLVAASMVQRPDLVNAAVLQAPLTDMLRYDKLLAGASWTEEFGDPDDAAARPSLEALSPFHNLRRMSDFPAPLIFTSTADDRVHPAHARKFAAKMESLNLPFYFYESVEGGHQGNGDQEEAVRRRAMEITYLMKRLMD